MNGGDMDTQLAESSPRYVATMKPAAAADGRDGDKINARNKIMDLVRPIVPSADFCPHPDICPPETHHREHLSRAA